MVSSRLTVIFISGILVTFLVAVGTSVNFIVSGGGNPVVLLYFAASGLLGSSAFEGGSSAIFTGIVIHTLVSFGWAIAFYFLFSRLEILKRNLWMSALATGVVIWAVMFFVVMPISSAPSVTFDFRNAIVDVLVLTIGSGLPMALLYIRHFQCFP